MSSVCLYNNAKATGWTLLCVCVSTSTICMCNLNSLSRLFIGKDNCSVWTALDNFWTGRRRKCWLLVLNGGGDTLVMAMLDFCVVNAMLTFKFLIFSTPPCLIVKVYTSKWLIRKKLKNFSSRIYRFKLKKLFSVICCS